MAQTQGDGSSSHSQSHPSSSSSSPLPNIYVVHFPLSHPTFRFPVFRSVAQEYSIPLRFYPLPSDTSPFSLAYQDILDSYDATYQPEEDAGRPFALVSLPSDREAALMLEKCSVVKSITHLWAAGNTTDGLLTALQQPSSECVYDVLRPASLTWKADVAVIGVKQSQEDKNRIIESLGFLSFQGPVNLKNPHFELVWWEERWGLSGAAIPQQNQDASMNDQLRLAVAGRRITLPKGVLPARDWIERLDLKKRKYIGNTSMEAEMSLNHAQMALSSPAQGSGGKIVYDPFVGTGSLLIACAAMGAYVFGSDIDGRMMRGKADKGDRNAETGITRAAKQYGLQDKFLDCLTFDITQHPWRIAREAPSSATSCSASCSCASASSSFSASRRQQGFLDAVVADPPYGVRAGAKRLGHRDVNKQRSEPYWLEEKQGWSHEQEDYIPPTRPYALNDLLDDLLRFSAGLVKDEGRLVFWMPVMNEDEGESRTEVPDGGNEWDLVAVSTQDFGKWARRVSGPDRKVQQTEGIF